MCALDTELGRFLRQFHPDSYTSRIDGPIVPRPTGVRDGLEVWQVHTYVTNILAENEYHKMIMAISYDFMLDP